MDTQLRASSKPFITTPAPPVSGPTFVTWIQRDFKLPKNCVCQILPAPGLISFRILRLSFVLFSALEHLTPLSKICHPAVIDFFAAKNATAALISPSKRQKRHRGPDRPKIRPSEARSRGGCQFKLSQFPKSVGCPRAAFKDTEDFFWFIFLVSVNSVSSNLDLGQKFGQFGNFQQLCLGRSGKYQCLSKSGEGFIFVCLRPANVAQSPEASAPGTDNRLQKWILDFRILRIFGFSIIFRPFRVLKYRHKMSQNRPRYCQVWYFKIKVRRRFSFPLFDGLLKIQDICKPCKLTNLNFKISRMIDELTFYLCFPTLGAAGSQQSCVCVCVCVFAFVCLRLCVWVCVFAFVCLRS